MASASDKAVVDYVVSLQTTEQRRLATSISRPKLLAAVRTLADCQRCSFVEHVLAAFGCELSPVSQGEAGSQASACASLSAALVDPYTSGGHHSLSRLPLEGETALDERLQPSTLSPAETVVPTVLPSMPVVGTVTTCVMAPAQILELLLSPRMRGPPDLVRRGVSLPETLKSPFGEHSLSVVAA